MSDKNEVIDDLDKFFGLDEKVTDDGDAEGGNAGIDLTAVLPDNDSVPEPFRGKTVGDALSSYTNLLTDYTKKSQALSTLSDSISGDPKPDPQQQQQQQPGIPENLQAMFNMQTDQLVEMRLDTLAGKEPIVEKYRDEFLNMLQGMSQELRLNGAAWEQALIHLKGMHVDEIVAAKGPTSAAIPDGSGGGLPSARPSGGVSIGAAGKANVLSWFGGDENAAKSSLGGS